MARAGRRRLGEVVRRALPLISVDIESSAPACRSCTARSRTEQAMCALATTTQQLSRGLMRKSHS